MGVDDEAGSQRSLIWDVYIHPDWEVESEKFDADIAMLVLSNLAELGFRVQPVCLPEATMNEPVGDGSVVGWGKSENLKVISSKPTELILPAVKRSDCLESSYLMSSLSSPRTFCAGYDENKKGPCLGDSGGGWYSTSKSKPWTLTGVVSSSIINIDKPTNCDISKHSVYTNVGFFIEWINEKKKSSENVETREIEFVCYEDL